VSAIVDQDAFVRDAEIYRDELLAHCYRMLGSYFDAEDVVQETYVRAWRAQDGFEGRASVRTWLYRIATNACLSALQHRSRRVLPSGLLGPAEEPDAPIRIADSQVRFLEPFPMVPPSVSDPADIVADRSSLRLALIASLQLLPPRQRAVLILRDVLAFPAAEVAGILDMTVAAVKSALQRARVRIDELGPAADDVVEPESPQAQAILDRYIAAFENADAALLEDLLRGDASLEVTGSTTWFAGKLTCWPYLARRVLHTPGEYRMFRVVANDQPAAVTYRRGADGVLRAFGIAVLTTDATHLAAITVFSDPALVAMFGYRELAP
jgi:RNA polymerase sigma-70 factor (ECF subfamily)